MRQRESQRVQGDALGEWAVGTVLLVSPNGMADVGKLYANLMLASGVQIDFQLRVILFAPQCVKPQGRLPRVFCLRGHDLHAVQFFVLADPILQSCLVGFHDSGNHGPISLCHRARLELAVQSRGSFRRPGEHDHAADQRVQPADDAQIDIAGLVVFPLNVMLGCSQQGLRLIGDSHRGQTSGLGKNQQVIIFKDHVKFCGQHAGHDRHWRLRKAGRAFQRIAQVRFAIVDQA